MGREPVKPTVKEKPGSPAATTTIPDRPGKQNEPTPEDLLKYNGGNINWLNGSYSGVDIKVVAHLYGQVSRDAELKKLQDELDYHAALIKMCEHLRDWVSANRPAPDPEVAQRSTHDNGVKELERACSSTAPSGSNEGEEAGRESWTEAMSRAFSEIYGGVLTDWLKYWRSLNNRLQFSGNIIMFCEYMIQSHTPVKKALEDQIKDIQTLINNSSTTLTLGTLQTISLSTHREKYAVLALGKSQAASYTRGPRTIAGSMIFTLFEEHPLKKLLRAMDQSGLYGETIYDVFMSTLLPDQLPPIDLTVVFANEYGSISKLGIYGVEFVNDGLTMSIEDLFTEETFNFVARDIDIMTHMGLRRLSQIEKMVHSPDGKEVLKGSSLYFSDQKSYDDYLQRLDQRLRFMGR